MTSTSSTPSPPPRNPRKPTLVYSLTPTDDGSFRHFQFQSPAPVPRIPTPPTPATATPSASSSTHRNYKLKQFLLSCQYASLPRGNPRNIYTH
ncbi:hypothetical protein M422DRAFT_266165, partial [Sphaerobolus stellatus SS14]